MYPAWATIPSGTPAALLGVTRADHVGDDHAEPRRQQRPEVAPDERRLREPVDQDDGRTVPLIRVGELAAGGASPTLRIGRHPLARAIASTTRTTRVISFTSCTRTMSTRSRRAPRDDTRRSLDAIVDLGAGERPDEPLAAGTDEHRDAEVMERADVVQDREVVFERLAEPDPGVDAELLEIDPAPTAPPRCDRPGSRAPRRPRRSTSGRPASSSARPSCASGPCPRRPRATTSNIAGSSPAETSFTMAAPASSAARATSGLRVSTDTGTSGSSSAMRRITGTTRCISSSAGTTSEPGRVDSPPTSSRSAPSATICVACFTASSTLA